MDIKELLARANAKSSNPRRVESAKRRVETDSYDDLEEFIDNVNTQTSDFTPAATGLSKDGQQLQVGDPVVGIHRGQEMSGQVIAVDGDMATVEWRDRETTRVRANQLTLSDVDDAYELQTMYVEAEQPYMGFDKESFVEDTDLESLLRGRSDGSYGTSYGDISAEL